MYSELFLGAAVLTGLCGVILTGTVLGALASCVVALCFVSLAHKTRKE